MTSDTDYVRRAMAAWFRSGSSRLPSEASAVHERNGRRYVELVNMRGTLAVYRIRNDGRLRRLLRLPKPPEAAGSSPAHDTRVEEVIDSLSQALGVDRSAVQNGDARFIDEEEDRNPHSASRAPKRA